MKRSFSDVSLYNLYDLILAIPPAMQVGGVLHFVFLKKKTFKTSAFPSSQIPV